MQVPEPSQAFRDDAMRFTAGREHRIRDCAHEASMRSAVDQRDTAVANSRLELPGSFDINITRSVLDPQNRAME